jgi:RNA polymerase sigma factor (sigma-70 family)
LSPNPSHPPKSDGAAPGGGGGPVGLLDAYAAKRGDLVRFFTARTGSAAEAEDLIQDLYLKLAAMPPGPAVEDPSAFLYRMTVNLMLDRARGQRRSAARDDAWRLSRGQRIGGVDAADEASPEDSAAARERLRRLAEAVQGLPAQTRRAFELHKLEGLSQAEAADRLGVSRKTVEKQVSAALRLLLAKLGRGD